MNHPLAVVRGERCLNCGSTETEHVGSVPDGIAMNDQFDCKECGAGWEGDRLASPVERTCKGKEANNIDEGKNA